MSHPNQQTYTKRDLENCADYLSGRSYDPNLVRPWYNSCRVDGNSVYTQWDGNWLPIIPIENVNSTLMQILEDPQIAAFSRDRLYEKIKTMFFGISKRDIEAFLKNLETAQLHHRYVRPK